MPARARARCGACRNPFANPEESIMNHRIALGLALLAGVAIGATAIQGLHAQAQPPAIVVVDISQVTDPEAWKAVTQRPTASTETVKQGGRYITRTDKITALDGAPPNRMVIIAFDSVEKAQAWYNSPGQHEINATRAKATTSRSFIVEGMPN
jgi:uncharacterized protein (DUF1330 family)